MGQTAAVQTVTDLPLAGLAGIFLSGQPMARMMGAALQCLADQCGWPCVCLYLADDLEAGRTIPLALAGGLPASPLLADVARRVIASRKLFRCDSGAGQKVVGIPLRQGEQVSAVFCLDHIEQPPPAGVLDCLQDLLGQALRAVAQAAQERRRLIAEQHRLAKALDPQPVMPAGPEALVGLSRDLHGVRMGVARLAGSRGPVLLQGETGSGRWLAARAIHAQSLRRSAPFVRVDCASLSEASLPLLFGVDKASGQGERKGLVDQAVGGTLYLDDVDQWPPALQTALQRLIEDRAIERAGASRRVKLDLRVMAGATTPRPADADSRLPGGIDGLFLPPLRQRPEDIPLLVDMVLQRLVRDGRRLRLDPDAMKLLLAYDYPGNVRELDHLVCQAARLAVRGQIRAQTVQLVLGSAG